MTLYYTKYQRGGRFCTQSLWVNRFTASPNTVKFGDYLPATPIVLTATIRLSARRTSVELLSGALNEHTEMLAN